VEGKIRKTPHIKVSDTELTMAHISFSIRKLDSKPKNPMIKLDIINEVVTKTGITKLKPSRQWRRSSRA